MLSQVTFEEAIGMLLLRAFMHEETMQLTEVQLAIRHIAMGRRFSFFPFERT
jgi:hypothetical protein